MSNQTNKTEPAPTDDAGTGENNEI